MKLKLYGYDIHDTQNNYMKLLVSYHYLNLFKQQIKIIDLDNSSLYYSIFRY
jgi:hypothetical protein